MLIVLWQFFMSHIVHFLLDNSAFLLFSAKFPSNAYMKIYISSMCYDLRVILKKYIIYQVCPFYICHFVSTTFLFRSLHYFLLSISGLLCMSPMWFSDVFLLLPSLRHCFREVIYSFTVLRSLPWVCFDLICFLEKKFLICIFHQLLR